MTMRRNAKTKPKGTSNPDLTCRRDAGAAKSRNRGVCARRKLAGDFGTNREKKKTLKGSNRE